MHMLTVLTLATHLQRRESTASSYQAVRDLQQYTSGHMDESDAGLLCILQQFNTPIIICSSRHMPVHVLEEVPTAINI